MSKLPTDSQARKNIPLTTGVLDYFPRALAYVAHISKVGNDKHNPGQPLHWAKHKSQDHADCIARHLVERGTEDPDGVKHSGYLAWRSLALLEEEIARDEGTWDDEVKSCIERESHHQELERRVDNVKRTFGLGPYAVIQRVTDQELITALDEARQEGVRSECTERVATGSTTPFKFQKKAEWHTVDESEDIPEERYKPAPRAVPFMPLPEEKENAEGFRVDPETLRRCKEELGGC